MTFFPTPSRTRTKCSSEDAVILGDGEEYALPVADDDMIDVEIGFDEDGKLAWIDDGGEASEGVDITPKGQGRLASHQRLGTFSPTSKPGIFLGYDNYRSNARLYCLFYRRSKNEFQLSIDYFGFSVDSSIGFI